MIRLDVIRRCASLLNPLALPFCNEQQVKQALAEVQGLMAAYHITYDEILKCPPTNQPDPHEELPERLRTRYEVRHSLACCICRDHYIVQVYTCGNYLVKFFGVPMNNLVAREVFRHLVIAFEDLWQQRRAIKRYVGRMEHHRRSFIEGVYHRVDRTCQEKKRTSITAPAQQLTAEGPQVALIEKKVAEAVEAPQQRLAAAYDEVVRPTLTKTRKPIEYVRHYEEYNAGYEAGRKVVLPY